MNSKAFSWRRQPVHWRESQWQLVRHFQRGVLLRATRSFRSPQHLRLLVADVNAEADFRAVIAPANGPPEQVKQASELPLQFLS
jgi:hypothetical protein